MSAPVRASSRVVRSVFAVLSLGATLFAQSALAANASPDSVWSEVSQDGITRSAKPRQIVPNAYRTVQLSQTQLSELLAQAPLESAVPVERSNSRLWLPTPDGGFAQYKIVESPVMAPELAKKFPNIRTYLGQGIDDPTATLRFDLTKVGFRAQIISASGTSYIDPFQPDDREHYLVYRKGDYQRAGERPRCLVTGEELPKEMPLSAKAGNSPMISSGANLRTYRLAMAATGEYTAFHGGTVADGLGGVVTTVNRVNGIYEREVSVRVVLVANNDQIIYTDANTDPYTNSSGTTMLGQNQTTLTNVIGSANYDVGHVVSTGGGGVAGLGVVCGGSKARGVTGSSAPIADGYDVDYVAHEMGHQFAGNHTFNGSGGSCSGGNRNGSTAYEPGSGISIQAYAGICGSDDTQPNSEDYFHRLSLNEILTFTTTGGGSNCGVLTTTGNNVPTVSTTAAFTIPRQTPFLLSASGSDADAGDALTYLWEQFDLGAANTAGSLVDNGGPLFRSFIPTVGATRTVPSLRYILNNANVAPLTAPLPGTTTPPWFTAELLPSTSRPLNFRVTVRDNRAGGGGTNEAATTLTVSNAAGPFAITAPNTAVSWAAGSAQTVTWNVANTNATPVNTANVRISLSVDGGYTYPIELAASVPNNGSAGITIPANVPASTQARVRVEAVGNIFFDVSDANFTLTGTNTAPGVTVTGSVSTRQGSPSATGPVATLSDTQDAAGSLLVSVTDAPPELLVSVVNSAGTVNLTATASCTLVSPTGSGIKAYPITLRVTDSAGAVTTAIVNVNVSANQVPTLGTYANLSVARSTTTPNAPSAGPADPNSNMTAPTVGPASLPGGGTISIAPDGVVTVFTTAGTTFGNYTVRPQANDSCGASEVRGFTLTVGSAAPVVGLVSSQVVSGNGNGLIEPNECNQLNVTLNNIGSTTATGVSATLSTTNPNVTITQATAAFADIASGQSRTSLTPFEISTNGTLTCFSTVDLSLNVTYTGGGPFASTISLPVGQPATDNYALVSSTGATIPDGGSLVAGTQVDDGIADLVVPAGFNFSVYGTNVTGGSTLRVSTNGNLQLVASGGSSGWSNGPLPEPGNADAAGAFPTASPVLMPYWTDLDLRTSVTGAGVYQQVTGTAPNRKWIIEWRGQHIDDTGSAQTLRFAIELSEGSNSFAYLYALTGVNSANGSTATIGVQAATTGTSFTQYSLNSASVSPGTRLTSSIPAAICSAGAGACSIPNGVNVVQSSNSTNLSEGGPSDTYTIALSAQPTGNVTVTISPDSQISSVPNSLTFTTLNWATPQTVTVTAVDDAINEGAHTGTISHSASGGGYTGVSIPSVTAFIVDNDSDQLLKDGFESF